MTKKQNLSVASLFRYITFGIKMSAIPDNPGKVKVDLFASPNAMEHWALQYLNYVEVTKTESLRERIKESLQDGIGKYN